MQRRDFLGMTGAVTLAAGTPGAPTAGADAASVAAPTRPRRLRPGDRVGLVAPASANFLSVDVEIAQDVVRAFSLEPRLGAHVRERHGYLAGARRGARGGRERVLRRRVGERRSSRSAAAGAARACCRSLDWDLLRRNPKVLIGYSDITALHCGLQARTGLVTFHGADRGSATGRRSRSSTSAAWCSRARQLTMSNPRRRRGTAGAGREPHAHDHARPRARPAARRQPHRADGAHRLALPARLRRRDPVPRGHQRGDLPRRPHADAARARRRAAHACAASSSARARSASPARATARSRSRRCSTSTSARSASPLTRAP